MSGTSKPNVAFICVHNSCRSQIAEALGKELACDVFASYSAGTERQERINQDAVRLMKQSWGIDMEKTKYSKLLEEIPQPDIVILMGCNVSCPHLTARHTENRGLEDPSRKGDDAILFTINEIEKRVRDLRDRILAGL